MRMIGLLAIGFVVALSLGCATSDMTNDPKSMEPNMTADLVLGDSADSILSKYGKPIYKKGRINAEGKKIEDWFYANAMLSFKDSNLNSFKPK